MEAKRAQHQGFALHMNAVRSQTSPPRSLWAPCEHWFSRYSMYACRPHYPRCRRGIQDWSVVGACYDAHLSWIGLPNFDCLQSGELKFMRSPPPFHFPICSLFIALFSTVYSNKWRELVFWLCELQAPSLHVTRFNFFRGGGGDLKAYFRNENLICHGCEDVVDDVLS